MALGDDSLLAYQGMLSRLECLQAEFSCFRSTDVKPMGDGPEVLSSLSEEDHFEITVKSAGIF